MGILYARKEFLLRGLKVVKVKAGRPNNKRDSPSKSLISSVIMSGLPLLFYFVLSGYGWNKRRGLVGGTEGRERRES